MATKKVTSRRPPVDTRIASIPWKDLVGKTLVITGFVPFANDPENVDKVFGLLDGDEVAVVACTHLVNKRSDLSKATRYDCRTGAQPILVFYRDVPKNRSNTK